MSNPIKSILHGLLEKLNNDQDFERVKATCTEYINATGIKDTDKRRMVMTINHQLYNTAAIYRYLYNSLLKFEGLGTVGRKEF